MTVRVTQHTCSFHLSSPCHVPGNVPSSCDIMSFNDPLNLSSSMRNILILELRTSRHRNAKLPARGSKPQWDFNGTGGTGA